MTTAESSGIPTVVRTLVIGKFWPPHRGHHRMIDEIAGGSDALHQTNFIVVCAARGQRPPGRERARWLQAVHPTADIIVVDDLCAGHFPEPCRPECTPLWVERILSLGLGDIHRVGTNEEYGPGFAAGLGAEHVFTDRRRLSFPISGTSVRDDLASMRSHLHPVVQAGLYRRLAIVGAESTGTSTLSRALAETLGAPVTSEAGRTVSWEMYAEAGGMEGVVWQTEDFWSIVDHQIRLEHDAVWVHVVAEGSWQSGVGPLLVCDTETLATVAWRERYLGQDSTALIQLAHQRLADFYIVTSPKGITFDDSDPTRDGRKVRLAMHERFRELVAASGRPWIEVNGSPSQRLEQALEFLVTISRENPVFVHHSNNR